MQYQINLPMQFRVPGEKPWHNAWIDSMSLREIIFKTEGALDPGKTLNIHLLLPQPRGGHYQGVIVAKATVTYSKPLSEPPGHVSILAALSSLRLLRLNPRIAAAPPDSR